MIERMAIHLLHEACHELIIERIISMVNRLKKESIELLLNPDHPASNECGVMGVTIVTERIVSELQVLISDNEENKS